MVQVRLCHVHIINSIEEGREPERHEPKLRRVTFLCVPQYYCEDYDEKGWGQKAALPDPSSFGYCEDREGPSLT